MFFLIYIFSISLLKLHWSRWIIPLLPFFSIISVFALCKILSRKKDRVFKMLIVAIVFITPLTKSLIYNHAIVNNRDTRLIAKQWIGHHLKEKKIAYDGYTPKKSDGPHTIAKKPLSSYKKENYQYLVVSSAMYKRYLAEPERYKRMAEFYTTLFQNYSLTITFPSNPISQNYQNDIVYNWVFWYQFLFNPSKFLFFPLGPEIRVYKLT